MNTDQESLNHLRAFITYKHPAPKLEFGYQYTKEDYPFAALDDEEVIYAKRDTEGIIRCSFTALQLAIIPRHIMEQVTFYTDVEYNNIGVPRRQRIDPKWGGRMDVVFAKECSQLSFGIYTDLNMECLHLKPSNNKNLSLQDLDQVGIKKPNTFFLKANSATRVPIDIQTV